MTTATAMTCEGRLWTRGEDRRCGQVVGVRHWTDSRGEAHAGCPRHAGGLQRRYPATLPEDPGGHGKLVLTTPWARGAFGPADAIEVAKLIPEGCTVNVAMHANRSGYIVWGNRDGQNLFRWEHERDAVAAAKLAARALQAEVEPVWLHEELSMLRCSECEELLQDGVCPIHANEGREGWPEFNGAFDASR